MGRSGVAGLNYCLTDNKFQQEHIELGPEKVKLFIRFFILAFGFYVVQDVISV